MKLSALTDLNRRFGGLPWYLAGSALALVVDTGLLMAALSFGLPLAAAATLGFVAGAIVAYTFSVRLAFSQRRLRDARLEAASFVLIGALGLLLTQAALWLLVGQVGMDALPAKLTTACFVFLFNFGLRKQLLFTTSAHVGHS